VKIGESGDDGLIGYTGKYLVSMDDNGRLAVPARLRKQRPLGVSSKKQIKGYVLAKWIDGCLGLFIESEWVKRLQELRQDGSGFKRKNRIFNRHLSPNAYTVVPDNQGRVTIPKDLIKVAGLQGETLIVGATDYIEIWNPERFEKFLAENMSFEESADQLFGD
jgi:MraZ protein